jgi:hypothetical protein
MADAALAGDAPDAVDDIVRGKTGGLIQNKERVYHSSPWSRKAGFRSTEAWLASEIQECRMM